jgi:hypothetical protein
MGSATAQPSRIAYLVQMRDGGRHERQRYDNRNTNLVQRTRDVFEEAGGIGERVGCANAEQDGEELESGVQRRNQSFEGDFPPKSHTGHPFGQRDFGQRHDHRARYRRSEQHLERQANDKNDDTEHEKCSEARRPRCITAPCRND